MKPGNWIKYKEKYPLTIKVERGKIRKHLQITPGKPYKILKVNTLMGKEISYEVEFGDTYFTLHVSNAYDWTLDLEKERLEKLKLI